MASFVDKFPVVPVGEAAVINHPDYIDWELTVDSFDVMEDLNGYDKDTPWDTPVTFDLLGFWFEQVGRAHRHRVPGNAVMAPAPGTMYRNMDMSEVAATFREWVSGIRKGAQDRLTTDLRRQDWWQWMSGEEWSWFTLPDPEPVAEGPGFARETTGNHFVVEVRWCWSSLNDDAALIAIPKTAPFSALVEPIMESVNFWEDHLWHFQVSPDRTTKQTSPFWLDDRGARISGETTRNAMDMNFTEVSRWAMNADDTPLNTVLRNKDQFWFLFDYGDNHLFRLRVHDGNRAGGKAVKAAHEVLGRNQRWPDEPTLVRPMPGGPYRQYPTYDDDDDDDE
jgi:hypothetical protein